MKNILFIILSFLLFSAKQDNSQFVEVNSCKFHIKEIGKGNPVVIFESGLAIDMQTWNSISDSIAKDTRVFLYDRAGIGLSDTISEARTIPNMIEELKLILDKENIRPPYILVGQSMGGYLVRYFANKYPHDVKGILLIDPASEEVYDNMSKEHLEDFVYRYNTKFENRPIGERREWNYFFKNREYMRNISISDSIRIILLSATQFNWFDFHAKMIQNNPHAKHLRIEGHHELHKDKPELVIKFIRELISSKSN